MFHYIQFEIKAIDFLKLHLFHNTLNLAITVCQMYILLKFLGWLIVHVKNCPFKNKIILITDPDYMYKIQITDPENEFGLQIQNMDPVNGSILRIWITDPDGLQLVCVLFLILKNGYYDGTLKNERVEENVCVLKRMSVLKRGE